MKRSILALVLLGAGLVSLSSTGCNTATGIGDLCIPTQEYTNTFNGFSAKQVNIESSSFQCQTRVCLANHFRGRVSCPAGQDINGIPPIINGVQQPQCVLPETTLAAVDAALPASVLINNTANPSLGACVPSQCVDRQPADAVYCSCRCANVNGQTNDGANYCKCPNGFQCTQLVSSIGSSDTGLTGAYCIKSGTEYSPAGGTPSCTKTIANDLLACGGQ